MSVEPATISPIVDCMAISSATCLYNDFNRDNAELFVSFPRSTWPPPLSFVYSLTGLVSMLVPLATRIFLTNIFDIHWFWFAMAEIPEDNIWGIRE